MFTEINATVAQRIDNVNAIAVKKQIHVIKPIERNKTINKQKMAIAKQIDTIINEFIL